VIFIKPYQLRNEILFLTLIILMMDESGCILILFFSQLPGEFTSENV